MIIWKKHNLTEKSRVLIVLDDMTVDMVSN